MTHLHLFRSALKDLLRPGRLFVSVLMILLPSAIALTWRFSVDRKDFPAATAYDSLEPGLVFGFILVILTVMFATGVISQEVEQKTIVYLLTRPVSRPAILLSRFAAAFVVILGTVWLATIGLAVSTFGPAHLAGTHVGRDLLILPVGVLAYGALFLLIAAVLTRPLLWGLLYTFGWESWVPSMPGSFKKASLATYLRVLAPHSSPHQQSIDVGALLAQLSPAEVSTSLSWWVLASVIVIGLAGALYTFSTREYVPRDDAI